MPLSGSTSKRPPVISDCIKGKNTMPLTDEAICKITSSVLESILDVAIHRCSHTGEPDDRADGFITGAVSLTGAWEGTVAVHCTTGLACRAASVMFGREEASVSASEIYDALGELANMISGNLKTLLPKPSFLSLPCVVEGFNDALEEPESATYRQITWDCGGQSLMVTVLQKPCHAVL